MPTKIGAYSLIVALLSVVPPAFAQSARPEHNWKEILPGLHLGGSFKTRVEYKDDFNFQRGRQDYLLTRTRLSLRYQPVEQFEALIEGQDARVFSERLDGIPPLNEDATPNIFADQLDLHQAYVRVLVGTPEVPFQIKVGRQKFNLGAKRLVSSLEWVNTARVWDALRVTIGDPKTRSLDVFASWLVPVYPDRFNDHKKTGNRYADSLFHGLYYTDLDLIPDGALEAYYLLRQNPDAEDQVHTLGARTASSAGLFGGDLEGAIQLGTYGDLDHMAYMFHAGAWVSATHNKRVVFSIAYNLGSGDGDPNDGDHETFDNLFPLNHAYYGYMDFFALMNLHNMEGAVQAKPLPNLVLRAAYQGFFLVDATNDAWYNAGGGVVRPASGKLSSGYVGNELDFTAVLKLLGGHLAIEGGYSHFFAGRYISQTGPAQNDADFLYLQLTATL